MMRFNTTAPILETERLWLVALPLWLIRRRLIETEFIVELAGLRQLVFFPPLWPGDLLALFPMWDKADQADTGTWVIVSKNDPEQHEQLCAIGAIGCKGLSDAETSIELGYGLNADRHGQGFATEAVRAVVSYLAQYFDAILAETSADNFASQRVLIKAGFIQVAHRLDRNEGVMLSWQLDC